MRMMGREGAWQRKKIYSAMEAMLEEGLHSDLKLEVEDGEFMMAHRSVLASMSPVFKCMFNQDMTNSNMDVQVQVQVQVIKLEEITSGHALRVFLRLIYLGTLDADHNLSWEHALQILAASDKYDLPLVKAIVAKELAGMLTVENSLIIFEAADKYEGGLTRKCKVFVEKHFRDVVLTKAFEQLAARKPSLLVGLVRNKMQGSMPRKLYAFLTSKFFSTPSAAQACD